MRYYIQVTIVILLGIFFVALLQYPYYESSDHRDYEDGWNAGYEEGQYDAEVSMDDELNQYFCDGYEGGYNDALEGIEPQY